MSLTHLVKSLGLLYMVYDLFNSSSQISSAHIKFSDFICLFPFPFPLFPSAAKQIPLKRKEKKRRIFSFYPIFSQQPNKSVPTNKIKIKRNSKISFSPYFLSYSQLPNQSQKKNLFSPYFLSNQTNQYQPKLEKKNIIPFQLTVHTHYNHTCINTQQEH